MRELPILKMMTNKKRTQKRRKAQVFLLWMLLLQIPTSAANLLGGGAGGKHHHPHGEHGHGGHEHEHGHGGHENDAAHGHGDQDHHHDVHGHDGDQHHHDAHGHDTHAHGNEVHTDLTKESSPSHRDRSKPNAFAPNPYPSSNFSCRGRPPGYYADMTLNCGVYHLCNRHGGGMAFECPGGTMFQQRAMVCDHWYMVDCQKSGNFYDSNLRIGQRNLRLIDGDSNVFMQVVVKDSIPPPPPVRQLPPPPPPDHQLPPPPVHQLPPPSPPPPPPPVQLQVVAREEVEDTKKSKETLAAELLGIPAEVRKDNEVRSPRRTAKGGKSDQVMFGHFSPTAKAKNNNNNNKVNSNNNNKVNSNNNNKVNNNSNSNNLGFLPNNARVVGVRPLRSQLALSNRDRNPEVLTLDEFLHRFPDMDKVKTIPVEVKSSDAVKMIEHLATTKANFEENEHLLQELDDIIVASDREARKVVPQQQQKKQQQQLQQQKPQQQQQQQQQQLVRPRGGGGSNGGGLSGGGNGGSTGTGGGGDNHALASGLPSSDLLPPEMEFGFLPLLPPTEVTTEVTTDKSVLDNDKSFFFTTTETASAAAAAASSTSSSSSEEVGGKRKKKVKKASSLGSLFDVRNLFYIPSDKQQQQQLQPSNKKFSTSFFPASLK